MLYLILSATGGGKTTHIMNIIEQFSRGGHKKITLIVPEQFSFMSEKIMLSRIGAKAMADIDVVSFTSLGEKLVGKPALHERRRLDDPSKAVLMSMALESVKDKLTLYGKHASRKSVISVILLSFVCIVPFSSGILSRDFSPARIMMPVLLKSVP